MNKILRTLLYIILFLAVVIAGVALLEGRKSCSIKVVRRAPKSASKIAFKNTDAVDIDINNTKLVRYFKDNKVGVADSDGNVITDAVFDSVDNFYGDVAMVKLNGKYGFMSSDSTYIVAPKYVKANPFNNGFAIVVADNGKYGVVNEAGMEVVKPNYYDYIGAFDYYKHAVARNKKDNKYVVIDGEGNVVKNLVK